MRRTVPWLAANRRRSRARAFRQKAPRAIADVRGASSGRSDGDQLFIRHAGPLAEDRGEAISRVPHSLHWAHAAA